jgi:hypothetical protein
MLTAFHVHQVSAGIYRCMQSSDKSWSGGQAYNEQLDDYETIKKYYLINKRFSEENGEVTPTRK